MTISSFKFSDGSWQLNETHFGHLTLLVGISGVGKTKTLRAILRVCDAGLKSIQYMGGCSWTMTFHIEGRRYCWEAEISAGPKKTPLSRFLREKDADQESQPVFLRELISVDGSVLIDRNHGEGKFLFKNNALPKLKWTESAITLLGEEEVLSPLRTSLLRVETSYEDRAWVYDFGFISTKTTWDSLPDLRAATDYPLIVRCRELQNKFYYLFENVKNRFIETFPFIDDIRVVDVREAFPDMVGSNPFGSVWTLAFREKENQEWIPGWELSTGMSRTLKLLFELSLSPDGTLFLIDEFENSLGINCLPQVADAVKERQGDIQFILTSHNPYVINNISWKSWKLVTRQGGMVTIRDVQDIPSLNTKSSLDRFLLLVNSPEYEEGIQ